MEITDKARVKRNEPCDDQHGENDGEGDGAERKAVDLINVVAVQRIPGTSAREEGTNTRKR